MRKYLHLSTLLCFMLVAACDNGKHSPIGFSLPEGDSEAGKSAFVELACNTCHSTPDIEQLDINVPEDISIVLGGDFRRVKTYADLVTSIINPSHRISKAIPEDMAMTMTDGNSLMPSYNSMMTVEQLTNIVTYLQPHYTLRPYERTMYHSYQR